MNPQIILYIVSAIVLGTVLTLNWKYNLLKDSCTIPNVKRPYSYSRVQATWWFCIIFSCLISVILTHRALPVLDKSTIILFSLALATNFAAGMIDDKQDADATIPNETISRNMSTEGFWLDILSDKNGMSIPRVQAAALNFAFGFYFLYMTWFNLMLPVSTLFPIDNIMPVIGDTYLILMGASASGYAAFKARENKAPVQP